MRLLRGLLVWFVWCCQVDRNVCMPVSGVLLGAIIVLATEVGDGDIGLLLAFGGGTYMYHLSSHINGPSSSRLLAQLPRRVCKLKI